VFWCLPRSKGPVIFRDEVANSDNWSDEASSQINRRSKKPDPKTLKLLKLAKTVQKPASNIEF